MSEVRNAERGVRIGTAGADAASGTASRRPLEGHCKLKIENCKLRIGRPAEVKFAVFNFQFAIFNPFGWHGVAAIRGLTPPARQVFHFLVALLLLLPAVGWGANSPKTGPLKLALTSIVPRPRSQAPQTIELSLHSDLREVLQGRLEIQWYYGKDLVHNYVSPELAVMAGTQRLRLVLPVFRVDDERIAITAYPRFVTARQVFDLGEIDHRVLTEWRKRAFVAVDVQPHEVGRHEAERGIADSIALEKFNPHASMRFDMLTYPATVLPEDLPPVAAGYVCFDLLVLEEEGFRQLKGTQIAAIGQWVEGGGSIIVAPRGNMTAAHVELLNRLSGRTSATHAGAPEPAYSLDETGKLVIAERALAVGRKFAPFYSGLGRTVIVHERLDPRTDFASPEWRGDVAFLWKVRKLQVPSVVNRGEWDFPAPQTMFPDATATGAFRPGRDDLPQSIRSLLLPDKVEGLPLSIVVVILTLFLLAIAPGDYFLLGRLNCRKYTWVLFAAVSTLFTLATVKIADSYMGHTDYRTHLTLVDLGETEGDGAAPRVVRTNRFELLFAATQRAVETDFRNALYADLTYKSVHQQLDEGPSQQFTVPQDKMTAGARDAAADLALFEGTMPVSFKVHQQLRQWSPRITRQTTFGDDASLAAEAKIDWSALNPRSWSVASGRQVLRDVLLASEPDAEVLLFNGPDIYDVGRDTEVKRVLPGPNAGSAGRSSYGSNSFSPIGLLVKNMSVQDPARLFAVVSQISPTGSDYLEDLTLVDEGDSGQWLLVVALRRDNDWLVFRKLFRADRQ